MSRRREPRVAIVVALLAAGFAGCGRQDGPPRSTPSGDAGTLAEPIDAALDASASASNPEAGAAGAALSWPDAIRVGRFAEADEAIARLAPAEQQKPEVRLARARVA
ncbi:MAG: hypothetical protein K0S65_1455, partial [Labilithrix sp.]|nr:hypothetical protein [Labilithrix sp.]